jgi:hypothetical protein
MKDLKNRKYGKKYIPYEKIQQTKPEERLEWEKEIWKTNIFQVSYAEKDFARTLGAKWNGSLKKWMSPNDTIWHKMIRYFLQFKSYKNND